MDPRGQKHLLGRPEQGILPMDIWFNLVLFVHLVALVVGAATNVVMPVIGGRLAKMPPEMRGEFGAIAGRLSRNSQIALGLLVITGIIMVALRYGGLEGASPWFIAKLVLVGLLGVVLVAARVIPPARFNPRVFGMLVRLALLGIIFCAVMAFN
jgi:uncharacterized membrane protein